MSPPPSDRHVSGDDPNSEIHRVFWVHHIRIGFGVFLGETLVVMFYLGVTPHEGHRFALKVIVAAWFALATAGLFGAPALATSHWRALFSASWTIVSVLAVGVVAVLDGGVDSPLLFLLFLPVGFSALAFTPVLAAACGVAALSSTAVVALIDPSVHLSSGDLLLLIGVLVGATILSVAASVNRTYREDHERRLSEQIAVLASTDGLTGCAVHRVFHSRLEEEISRAVRTNRPLSLLMIDVDDFKGVNDTYGHLIGDHVLAAIGGVLRSQTRSFELVGRLGGDEFAVLMPETETSHAIVAGNRFRDESSRVVEVPVTLSIGVSGLDLSMPTAERMLDDADFALYQVKHGGRDGVTQHRPEKSLRTDQIEQPDVSTHQVVL
jgi:diguanylate cyclase (GGDEF)-like protein